MGQAGTRPRGGPVRRLVAPAAVLGALIAGAALVAVVDPHEPGHYPPCPLLATTGLYCPGCGGLRMVHELAHGHLGVAFGLNPLAFALLPVLGYLWVRWAACSARGEPMTSPLLRPRAAHVLVVVVVVYWVLRNLPFASALAP